MRFFISVTIFGCNAFQAFGETKGHTRLANGSFLDTPTMNLKVIFLVAALASLSWKEKNNKADAPGKDAENAEEFINSGAVNEDAFAFPGAEGGGMKATGGRGGKIYKVTSLADNATPGTLRYAIEQDQARIIVFDVSGTINLKSALRIRYGNVTIAGQTAPGAGICLAHWPVSIDADNVIIRFIRCRMGDGDVSGSGGADGADAMGGRQRKNIIIDHCSISWSTDEACSFYDNENFTLQWSIISESLRLSGHSKGPHGYGGIWGGVNASFHHNLMAHHDSRTPRLGPGALYAGKDRVDMRNNVFYNWNGNGCYGGEAMKVNFVNNYYKPGPATASKVSTRVVQIDQSAGGGDFEKIKGLWGQFYVSGNYFPENAHVTADNWAGVNAIQKAGLPGPDHIRMTEEIPVFPVRTDQAKDAYEKVLSYAGCSKLRDAIDIRIVDEVRNKKAAFKGLSRYNGYDKDYPGSDIDWKSSTYPREGIIDSQNDLRPAQAGADWSPWPALDAEKAGKDVDQDGMPDVWERAQKLDPLKANANGRDLSTVYDNIEVYLNSLVKEITLGQQR